MSNIYVNEPPTSGKVCMQTSVGEIDIELWSKEAPKACRNFIQLALEGYFDNTIFHRVVKDFIVQGGDPTGTGLGGDSIYDNEPFKDEFHSRLKFTRRGLVALANAGKDDNKSQFFFTLAATPELNNKHTIFGKVTGTTIFNMLKLQEGVVDHNERPEIPKKIYSIDVLKNPFDDIVPRAKKVESKVDDNKVKSKSKATKDFKLLSFGEEAEEEESDLNMVIEREFKIKKGKSAPDLIDQRANKEEGGGGEFKKAKRRQVVTREESDEDEKATSANDVLSKRPAIDLSSSSEDEYSEEKKKMEKAREEIKRLKKEVYKERAIEKIEKSEQEKKDNNPVLNEFKKSNERYNKSTFSKGADREQQALLLLEKFKKKLKKEDTSNDESSSWLQHKLQIDEEEEKLVLAKDANLKGTNEEDWYEIYDPRNPLNKQRREMDAGRQPKKVRK